MTTTRDETTAHWLTDRCGASSRLFTANPLPARRKSTVATALKSSTTDSSGASHSVAYGSTSSIDEEEEAIYRELAFVSSEIVRHDRLYYDLGRSEISDHEYDGLCRREEEICRRHPAVAARWWAESGGTARQSRIGSSPSSTTAASSSSAKKKRSHLSPMLSLDNVHSEVDLLKWLDRIRKKLTIGQAVSIVTEPKLDGLSISIRYVVGRLVWAATRGDGRRGQDVTQAVLRYLPGLPTSLVVPQCMGSAAVVEVRGEVVMSKSAFAALRRGAENSGSAVPVPSNARNAAAGMLLRKQPASSELPSSELLFYAYDLVLSNESSLEGCGPRDGLDIRQTLKDLGYRVPEPIAVTRLFQNESERDNSQEWTLSDIQPMLEYSKHLQEFRQRQTEKTPDEAAEFACSPGSLSWGDYEMDGCVHKVIERDVRDLLGSTSRAPKWAIAHKLTPNVVMTRLLDVVTQVGRTGALTPVAVLEPVTLDGVVVQRATLHNFQHVQQLLGRNDSLRIRKNSLVWIRRSGDVIPQVLSLAEIPDPKPERHSSENSTLDDSLYVSLLAPSHCPACGSETVLETLRINNRTTVPSQVIRCGGPGLLCPPRAALAVQHAFSRDALDITGLSEARIRQMMDSGLLRVPSDLFALVRDEKKLEELAHLEGWGALSVRNLKTVADRVATEGVSFAKFLYSLSIRFIGAQTASLIANAYKTQTAFWEEVDEAAAQTDEGEAFPTLRQDTEETRGMGPAVLSALLAFAKDGQLTQAGKDLSQSVTIHDPPSSAVDLGEGSERPLHGLSVVFTGSLPANVSRREAQRLAKELLGAKSTPATLSKTIDWLVVGAKGGKKREQASQLGVRTMDAEEFLELVNNAKKVIT